MQNRSYAEVVKGLQDKRNEKETRTQLKKNHISQRKSSNRNRSRDRLEDNRNIWQVRGRGDKWSEIKYNVKQEDYTWLDESYVGMVHSVEMVRNLQERCQWFVSYMEGYFLVESELWRGVPLNVRGPDFFATMGCLGGKFICLDDNTSKRRRFDITRFLISTPIMNTISVKHQVKINESLYNIKFTEEEFTKSFFSLKKDFIPTFQSDSDEHESCSVDNEKEEHDLEEALEEEHDKARDGSTELEDVDMDNYSKESNNRLLLKAIQTEEKSTEAVLDSLEQFQVQIDVENKGGVERVARELGYFEVSQDVDEVNGKKLGPNEQEETRQSEEPNKKDESPQYEESTNMGLIDKRIVETSSIGDKSKEKSRNRECVTAIKEGEIETYSGKIMQRIEEMESRDGQAKTTMVNQEVDDPRKCLGGDSSAIRSVRERTGSNGKSREMVEFGYFTKDAGIDRFLLSEEWLMKWTDVKQWDLNRSISDHCPILLKEEKINWGPKPFKFFDAWLEQSGCKETIRNVWNSTVIKGWKGFRLKEKLKKTKKAFKKWSADAMKEVDDKINEVEVEIATLDKKGENTQLSAKDIKMRRRSFLNLWKNLKIKEKEKWQWPKLDGINFKQISYKDNEFLMTPFFEEEIKHAVWDCDSTKSPGPDGFNFREQYMAFIEGRQLMDGVVIINEVIDEVKKKKMKSFLFKVNFEKAYDKVCWEFIDYMLLRMGFNVTWRKWIQECLQLSTISILVNGSPTRQFPVSKGIREQYMAFIEGRQLMDGVVIINEVIDEVKKKKMKSFLFKVNFEKAYDKTPLSRSYPIGKVDISPLEAESRSLTLSFLWKEEGELRKINWVSWEMVCRQKEDGGLGVRDLKKFNLALMGKWWGHLASKEEGLWKRVIIGKYREEGGHWMDWVRDGRGVGSLWWRDVCSINTRAKENVGWLAKGFRLKIGEGKGEKECYQMGNTKNGTWRWNLAWRRTLFEWEKEVVKELHRMIDKVKISSGYPNKCEWIYYSKDGHYSMKIAYSMLAKEQSGSNGAKIFERIWNSMPSSKISTFNWRLMLDRIPTKGNLLKRGVIKNTEDRKCIFCEEKEEDSNHLFLN
ncbi:hypothetical protein SLEP1_g40572 [Rubroshorea leprosula]|uniref:Reverse transcriptase zinc-binding domain-containing protein n=1 Tax=Rubroshorea leprosula TaxID=152421 RepID=A0AAV5L3T7_9ROSI|nr:hypothetical protein SLEP1_g40572 [Rubroshorea leprosula]